ncbi:cyclic AMP response element-binding protein A isoform X2 [Cylas formicarius]|uniref:cyclic AMP response element-binding protein A isoform X2 n=1 Tax=Cylas formicarius TaxID=197179 RepID=UPI002958341D|nr:cyclic AMP response element-binding protein A isoform X2 [Cylas formicarius]
METCFEVDKSLYDIGSADELKELWESDLDPNMNDVLRLHSGDGTIEWAYNLDTKDIPAVILHDRLMTDAALGSRPIKTEHSYSLTSDGDSTPDSPHSRQHVDDMEEEYYPAIKMNTACTRLTDTHDTLDIKEEADFKEEMSETESVESSCPSSPQGHFIGTNDVIDVNMATLPQALLNAATSNLLLTSPHSVIPQRIHIPKYSIKIENGNAFHLPPTPPSCSSSDDSEDNATISQPPSPASKKSSNRLILNHATSTRQPIHTPLISSQPKGSIGTLNLTEEEKRTLIAEGYPVPTRLPLTKAEEKSLKKVRRKIKNKISAQESRRKKKEYMDQLERKVETMANQNSEYRLKIEALEDSNNNLMGQLQKLQAIVARTHPEILRQLTK